MIIEKSGNDSYLDDEAKWGAAGRTVVFNLSSGVTNSRVLVIFSGVQYHSSIFLGACVLLDRLELVVVEVLHGTLIYSLKR